MIGNRQAPNKKLVNPSSQVIFIASRAASRTAPTGLSSPRTRQRSQTIEPANPINIKLVTIRSAGLAGTTRISPARSKCPIQLGNGRHRISYMSRNGERASNDRDRISAL